MLAEFLFIFNMFAWGCQSEAIQLFTAPSTWNTEKPKTGKNEEWKFVEPTSCVIWCKIDWLSHGSHPSLRYNLGGGIQGIIFRGCNFFYFRYQKIIGLLLDKKNYLSNSPYFLILLQSPFELGGIRRLQWVFKKVLQGQRGLRFVGFTELGNEELSWNVKMGSLKASTDTPWSLGGV